MLKDESPIVRHESAVALSSTGATDALSQLERAISDNDEDVSNSALIAYEYSTYLRRNPSNVLAAFAEEFKQVHATLGLRGGGPDRESTRVGTTWSKIATMRLKTGLGTNDLERRAHR
jgi:hypothetical protein